MLALRPALAQAVAFGALGPLAAAQSWTETANVMGSNQGAHDRLGIAVGVSGSTAVAGARWGDGVVPDTGAAYVYERGAGTWGEVAHLFAPDGKYGDSFGEAVAVDGDVIVVGAKGYDGVTPEGGAAYVFERDQGGPGNWGLARQLIASDSGNNDQFGLSVALSGDWVAIGAPTATLPGGVYSAGAVYLFRRNKGGTANWGEVRKVRSPSPSNADEFGRGLALDGDTLVAGAPLEVFAGMRGSAYVFLRDLGGKSKWGFQHRILASNGAVGDEFGGALSISNDTLVVGAPRVSQPGGRGVAYVFERDLGGAGAWGEVVQLVPADGADVFAETLAVSGDTLVVGDRSDNQLGSDAGAVHVFRRDQGGVGTWGEVVKVTASNGQSPDLFGWSVDVSGVVAVAGAILDDAVGPQGGSAYVIEGSAAQTYCTAGTSASGCRALLASQGTPSATATSGFVVSASGVEGATSGTFFYGVNGRQAHPWGNGTSLQCVVPPVRRGGTLAGSGTAGACDGAFAQDLNARWCPSCPKWKHNPGAGAIVQSQLWYRDPANTSNQTTSFSDALEFTVAP